jgi:hypothetical protein
MDHGQLPKKSQTSGLNGGFIGQLMVYDPNRQGAIGEANLAVGSTTGTAGGGITFSQEGQTKQRSTAAHGHTYPPRHRQSDDHSIS